MSEPGHWFERDPNWFKKAVFYEIHLRGFNEGYDDGSVSRKMIRASPQRASSSPQTYQSP